MAISPHQNTQQNNHVNSCKCHKTMITLASNPKPTPPQQKKASVPPTLPSQGTVHNAQHSATRYSIKLPRRAKRPPTCARAQQPFHYSLQQILSYKQVAILQPHLSAEDIDSAGDEPLEHPPERKVIVVRSHVLRYKPVP